MIFKGSSLKASNMVSGDPDRLIVIGDLENTRILALVFSDGSFDNYYTLPLSPSQRT
jgi:hypothetical protein